MEGKTPVRIYAQSTDAFLRKWGTKDSTLAMFAMDDGAVISMNISWALPEVWPDAVYGIVGSKE